MNMKNKINKDQLVDVINRYRYKKDACKHLGISIYQLNNLLSSYQLNYPKIKQVLDPATKKFATFSFIDKKWLEDNWINTSKSLSQLADEYGVKLGVLEGRRAYYKLNKPFKYQVSDKIYNDSDPNVSYLAGLIATDGYIPKNRLAVELDLTGDDERELLTEIKDYFSITSDIARYGNSNRLRIASSQIVEFFERSYNLYGTNKTFEVDVPKTFRSEACAKAYVRGCLDGDGTVYSSRYSFLICNASYKLIAGLAQIIETYTDQHLNVRQRKGKNSNYYSIGTTDKKARIILSWIYSLNPSDFVLKRKYLKFKMNFTEVDDIV